MVKERHPSPVENILQVAHNFNIISDCFSLHFIQTTVPQYSFLPLAVCLAIHKYQNFYHIYAIPSVINRYLTLNIIPMLSFNQILLFVATRIINTTHQSVIL